MFGVSFRFKTCHDGVPNIMHASLVLQSTDLTVDASLFHMLQN